MQSRKPYRHGFKKYETVRLKGSEVEYWIKEVTGRYVTIKAQHGPLLKAISVPVSSIEHAPVGVSIHG